MAALRVGVPAGQRSTTCYGVGKALGCLGFGEDEIVDMVVSSTRSRGGEGMSVVGIDPGARGGIAVLTDVGAIMTTAPMPTLGRKFDAAALVQVLTSLIGTSTERICLVVVEKVSAMPGQGVTSMFTFGRSFGAVEGAVCALSLPLRLVTPREWQREMHAGTDGGLEPKVRSLAAAMRIFPSVDLRSGSRAKKAHDGIVDALLIAEFGRRLVTGVLRGQQ